jgi:hypothetical protein
MNGHNEESYEACLSVEGGNQYKRPCKTPEDGKILLRALIKSMPQWSSGSTEMFRASIITYIPIHQVLKDDELTEREKRIEERLKEDALDEYLEQKEIKEYEQNNKRTRSVSPVPNPTSK